MGISDLIEFNKKATALLNGGLISIGINEALNVADYTADLNREQLSSGLYDNEKPIRPRYASTTYAAQKPTHPQRSPLTPNLKDKGDYHKSITAKKNRSAITLTATDRKAAMLKAKYETSNGKLIGLTPTSRGKFADLVRGRMLNKLSQFF